LTYQDLWQVPILFWELSCLYLSCPNLSGSLTGANPVLETLLPVNIRAVFSVTYFTKEILKKCFLNHYTSQSLWISFFFTPKINSAPTSTGVYKADDLIYTYYKLITFFDGLINLQT
jgi:hypothetical protein